MTQAYDALTERLKRIGALEEIGGILHWDQEISMPPAGGAQRAEELAALAGVIHGQYADPAFEALALDADTAQLTPGQRVNVAEARRLHHRATRVPARLAEELARETAKAEKIWEAAREANAFGDFAPTLGGLIDLKREEAACLAEDGQSAYDALLADFEPGATTDSITEIFDRLRAGLVRLRTEIAERGSPTASLSGPFPKETQLAIARQLGDVFGYDWQAGRLDLAVHPSSSGTLRDSRITTRVDPDNPLDCWYSTLHEVGHAVYEQNGTPENVFLPVGRYASMGIHESQSRLFENQLGRNRAFTNWLFDACAEKLGHAPASDPDTFYNAINRVEPGFIRTEADEVHYNLHIMMRFDLERDLISGALEVADLEEAWNTRFEADFGLAVPDARNGVLQDVHWSAGLFGYFPTYTLGNIYAGCLFEAMLRDLPDLESALAQADLAPVREWLKEHIHRHGRLYSPEELIARACGAAPSEEPLLRYLAAKFGGV